MTGRKVLGFWVVSMATVALLVVGSASAREPGAGAGASAGVMNPEPPRRLKSSSARGKKHGIHAGKATTHHGKRAGRTGKKSKKSSSHHHSSHHRPSKRR